MQLDEITSQEELERAHEYLLNKENHKTIRYVNKLLDKDPSNDQAWLILGIAKRRVGKFDEAIKCFETTIDLDQTSEEAWGLLTVTFMDKGDTNQAQITMKRAIELNPFNEKIKFYHDNLIQVYKKFGPLF